MFVIFTLMFFFHLVRKFVLILQSKVMLRGLTTFSQIEILGVENPIEFANRVYKGIYTPPTVIIFKYRCPDLEKVKKVSSTALGEITLYLSDKTFIIINEISKTSCSIIVVKSVIKLGVILSKYFEQ